MIGSPREYRYNDGLLETSFENHFRMGQATSEPKSRAGPRQPRAEPLKQSEKEAKKAEKRSKKTLSSDPLPEPQIPCER